MQFKTVKLRPDSPAVLEIYLRENQENPEYLLKM